MKVTDYDIVNTTKANLISIQKQFNTSLIELIQYIVIVNIDTVYLVINKADYLFS